MPIHFTTFFSVSWKQGREWKIWVFTLIFSLTRAANSFKTWYLMLPLMVFHRYQAYQSIQPQKYQFTSLLFSQSAENRGVSEKTWVFTLIFSLTRAANSFKTWYLILPLMVFQRYQAYQSIQPQKCQFTSLLFSQSAENRGVSEKYGYLP